MPDVNMADSTLSRVLRCRLRNGGVSLSQRLKLSKKVLRHSPLSFTKGAPVILEWLADWLNHDEKCTYDSKLIHKLWKSCHLILDKMVKSQSNGQPSNVLHFGALLNGSVAKLVTSGLKSFPSTEDKTKSYILDSCGIIVTSPTLITYFKRYVDSYICLLSTLIDLLIQSSVDKHNEKLRNLLQLLLNEEYIAAQQVDNIKIFKLCTTLLEPTSRLINCYKLVAGWEEVINRLVELIGSWLFNKSLDHCFNKIFLYLFENESVTNLEFLMNFILMLQESSCSQAEVEIASVFPYLFNSFLNLYRHLPNKIKFYFFILIVQLLGIEIYFSQKCNLCHKGLSKADFIDCENVLGVLADTIMVVACSSYIEYDDSDIQLDTELWFRTLADFLLNKVQCRTASWFKCFSGLLIINPLVVTSNVKSICQKAWLQSLQVNSTAECHQSQFFCELIETYANLNQIPKLITKILNASHSMGEISEVVERVDFPNGVSAKFGEVFVQLPPLQTIGIFRALNNHIIDKCLPLLSFDTGKVNESSKQLIFPPIELLKTLMLNARLIDVNLPKDSLTMIIEILHSISKSSIPQAILGALRCKDVSLLQISLLLAHAWGELHATLMFYNQKYARSWKEIIHSNAPSGGFTNISFVHYYIGAHEWDLIFKAICETKNPILLYIYELLMIQNIKGINLFGGEFPEMEQAIITSSANYLATHATVSNKMEVWNGQIFKLNNENFSVGTWTVICKNLKYILPYLSLEEIKHIAKIVVLTYNKDLDSDGSQSRCSLNLIKSQKFQELLSFQSAVLTTTFDSILEDFYPKSSHNAVLDKVQQLLTTLVSNPNVWMSLGDSRPNVEGLNDMWIVVQEASRHLTDLMILSRKSELISLEGFPISNIFNKLSLLNHLPLEFFAPGNQMLTLLAAFSVVIPFVNSSKCVKYEVDIIIDTLKITLRLFDGIRSNWFLLFINGKNVLLWMLESFMEFQKRLAASIDVESQQRHKMVEELGIQCLQSIMDIFIRKTNFTVEFEEFLTEVELSPSWKNVNFRHGCHSTITSASVILSSLHKVSLHSNFKVVCSGFIQQLTTHLVCWIKIFQSEYEFDQALYGEAEMTVIESFNVILKMNIGNDDVTKRNFSKQWKKLIPFVMKLAEGVSRFAKTCVHYETSCSMLCHVFKNRVKFKKYFHEETHKNIWVCLTNMLFCHKTSCSSSHREDPRKIIENFVIATNADEASWIFTKLLDDLGAQDLQCADFDTLHSLVEMCYIVLSTHFPSNTQFVLTNASTNFILLYQYLLPQIGSKEAFITIAVTILNTEAEIIKNAAIETRHLTLCLQGCSFLDLLSIRDYEIFQKMFHGVYLILNNILAYHPLFLTNHSPLYLNVILGLIHSIIEKGQQQLLRNANEKCVNIICECAQNVVRLLTELKGLKDPKTRLSDVVHNILVHYIERSSAVTLFPAVKNHLTDAMYATLDLCNERSIASTIVLLNLGGQNIFNDLYENYKVYYKYQGRI